MTNTATAEPFEPHWRSRDGVWYVVVLEEDARPGADVEVITRTGAVQIVTIATVGEAEVDYEGNLVCFCAPAPRLASSGQHGLLRHLAGRLAEVDPEQAEALTKAADNELLAMGSASEMITAAKVALGDDEAPS